jgi:hypothetical protein
MEPKWMILIRECVPEEKQEELRDAVLHGLKAVKQAARREERGRIAQYVESIDPGYELSVRHTITTFAEAIRAMPEEEHDGRD